MVSSSDKYLAGPSRNIPLKLRGKLRSSEKRFQNAALRAAQSELLLTEDSGYLEAENLEKTYKFTQSELKQHVDLNTQSKMFDLNLDQFGPYRLDYTRNGKHLLIGGRKGHIASFDWKTGRLNCEIQIRETVRDVKWLHNETMFAVAQKKYTFIYDQTGTEVHRLKDHIEVNKLDFLPYHFLLASVGNSGFLKYRDISTGKIVAEHRSGLGKCDVMTQNPHNAIIHLGHGNGTVTLWSPNTSTPLVKMLCHRGPIKALAIDRGGFYMASSGMDGQLKIFDIRTYKPVHEYFTTSPANCLSISDLGALAVGHGPHVNVWKDALRTKAQSPYMTHIQAGSIIEDIQFCSFEDVLGVSHASGIRSLIIPGTGEPNFDSLEANPYQTKKQRQESEVHGLLDKIQPEMISIDPSFIGKLDRVPAEVIAREKIVEWEANNPTQKFQPKKKQRGRSSAQKRYRKKQTNVIDSNKVSFLTYAKIELMNTIKEEKAAVQEGGSLRNTWDPFSRFKT